MVTKKNKPILCSVLILSLSMLPLFMQEAYATEYNLKDPASCKEMAGSWNSNFLICVINGLILSSGDKLIVDSGMQLENTGIITNNGGKIYNYGNITTEGFSVIINNIGGSIYNNGTITTSGGTLNNYASIYNHGSIDNYGTVYNYDIIYNYNNSTIDDRYGVTYNTNGTINNDCGSALIGLVPYGNQVRNVCSTMQSSARSIPSMPLPQSGTNTQAPLEQLESGIRTKDVICHDNYTLIIKSEDNSPACVTPNTANILIERGWGTLYGLQTSPSQGNLINSSSGNHTLSASMITPVK